MSLISPRFSATSASRSSTLAWSRPTSSQSSWFSEPRQEASAFSSMESWAICTACAPSCKAEASSISGFTACTAPSCLSLATRIRSSSAFSRRSSSTKASVLLDGSAFCGPEVVVWSRRISACFLSHISCNSPICRSRIWSNAAKSSSSFCFACSAKPTSCSLARILEATESSLNSRASSIWITCRRCTASASRCWTASTCWSL
mmetsp:Transcript_104905/g.292170  ORF Transcript_104905/g.292170 Transcript_104905/m.292170 type:complete len:204 (+) Transcript_104905:660-1271(+)